MDNEKSYFNKQCEEFEEINQSCGPFIEWKNNPLQYQSGKQCKYPLKFIITISVEDLTTQTPGEIDLHCIIHQSYPASAPTIKIALRFQTQNGNSNLQSTKSGLSMVIAPPARKHLVDDMLEEIRSSKTEKIILASIHYLKVCNFGLKIANGWFPKPSSDANSNSSSISQRWLLSHHFISQLKRHLIMEYAKELELTGFLIGGTPGYLYIEGNEDYQQCFISRLQCFNWQALNQTSFETATSRKCSEMVEFEGEPGLTQDILKQYGLDIPTGAFGGLGTDTRSFQKVDL